RSANDDSAEAGEEAPPAVRRGGGRFFVVVGRRHDTLQYRLLRGLGRLTARAGRAGHQRRPRGGNERVVVDTAHERLRYDLVVNDADGERGRVDVERLHGVVRVWIRDDGRPRGFEDAAHLSQRVRMRTADQERVAVWFAQCLGDLGRLFETDVAA